MFLLNSCQGYFRCVPISFDIISVIGKAILRTYGRLFAEFLEDLSLVHLRLLASPTCVGFRYGLNIFSSALRQINLEVFLGKLFIRISLLAEKFCRYATFELNQFSGFARKTHLYINNQNPIRGSYLFLPSLHRKNIEVQEY